MGLSARELLLVIRARDQATRVIKQAGDSINRLGSEGLDASAKLGSIGAAMMGVGTSVGIAGAAATAFFDNAVDSATTYEHDARLALTQTQDLGVELDTLKEIGKNTASEIAVDFDTVQGALFDIFSTIDTDAPGAQKALDALATGAVAGGTDLEGVGRSALAALNAYQLPAEDLDRVLDTQFKLVEKGVGSYEEFAAVIGQAIPASVSAGQTFETLAGSMAFLTRNGLSQARASTSAARAMELLTQPDVVSNLENIGVAVRDSEGNFKQMNEIVTDLATNAGWAEMSDPARKAAFEDIFGKGSIQARRFFDLAIPNYEDLNDLSADMVNSEGAMANAYAIMFEDPQNQVQLLSNQYKIMKQEIGDQLLPAKMKLVEWAGKLIDKWNGLSPHTKELIVKFGAIAAVVATVVGAIMTVVGGFLLFWSIIAPVVGGIGSVISIMSGVGAVFLAVVAVGVLLYQNWDWIKKQAKNVWGFVSEKFAQFLVGARLVGNWVKDKGTAIWIKFSSAAVTAFRKLTSGAQRVWGWMKRFYTWFDDNFGDGFRDIWDTLVTEFKALKEEFFQTVEAVRGYLGWVVEKVLWVGGKLLELFSWIGGIILAVWGPVWAVIKWVVKNALSVIVAVVTAGVNIMIAAWKRFSPIVLPILKAAWKFISTMISVAIKIISSVIKLVMNIIQGDWKGAWQNIKDILAAAWEGIQAAMDLGWELIKIFFKNFLPAVIGFIGDVFGVMWGLGRKMMSALLAGVKAIWKSVTTWLGGLLAKAKTAIGDAGSSLKQAGRDILNGLWDGLKEKWESVKEWLSQITGLIPDWKGPPARDRTLLVENGNLIMAGFQEGLDEGWKDVERNLRSLDPNTSFNTGDQTAIFDSGPRFNPSGGEDGSQSGGDAIGIQILGPVTFGTEEVVDDVDWFMKTKGAGV